MADENEKAQFIIDTFHRMYYHGILKGRPVWCDTTWLGIPVEKCPLDLWVYQEMIRELSPEVIVETGVMMGGSAAFMASICMLLGKGEVISVDIELKDLPRQIEKAFPNLTFIEGDSSAPEIVSRVKSMVAGRRALVILDSDHSRDHVLKEMRLYNDLVPVGCYMIVEDSNVNNHPVYPTFGPGPYEAIEEFLKENREFEIDKSREKFYFTFNPNGFLKRVQPPAGEK